ncbi:MAG: sugar transferase [Verrucomicrobia bacterium]|nr:sugar transferase [Verrucomicrobiota bacterium]
MNAAVSPLDSGSVSAKRLALTNAASSASVRLTGEPTPATSPIEKVRKAVPRAQPREHGYRLGGQVLVGDTIVAFLAILAGLSIREGQRTGWGELVQFQPNLNTALLIWSAVGSIVFVWVMMMFRSYDVKSIYRMQQTIKDAGKSSILWAVGAWACVGLFGMGGFSPRIGALYCVGTLFTGIVGWRLLTFAYLLKPQVKHAVSARTIVVGWTGQATHLREVMQTDLGQLAEIIGCVPMPGGRFAERPPADVAVLGDYSALPQLVAECRAASVVLADVSCSSAEIHHLISYCQRELLNFQLIPQYFPALYSGLQVQTVSGVPLLGVSQLPLDRTLNRVIKRGIDIVGGVVGLAISAAIIPFFCALVYLESPGPVIFRQRRTSRAGRNFNIYKIRSMRLNAESGTGAVWCKQEDSRRLKVGAFMRKTNIDELPQFWNVLKGDMSIVGPRPERPELIAKFKHEIPNYNARHEVRAGLTGWAQINGLRGDTDLVKRIEADLFYLENWSLLLDFYCIFATLVKRKNAY